MRSDDFNQILADSGIAPTWQSALGALGLAIAKAVAPQAFALIQKLAVTGAVALVKRLSDAMMPPSSPDYALLIVKGIEHDHQDWPAAQRAQYARDAIRQWAVDQGANPDDAMLNNLVEGAVSRLKVQQAAAGKALAG